MSDYRNRITEIRQISAADLIPNPSNWRLHPEQQGNALKGLLNQVGIVAPLVAYQSERYGGLVLIDGHLRQEIGGTWPCAILDVTDAEADLLLSVIDPIGSLAEMDANALADLLNRLEMTPVEDEGLAALLEQLAVQSGKDKRETVRDVEPEIDRAEELREKWGVEPGQLWQLGEHRLICGDCTDAEVIARLMDDQKADLIFTSPPYAQQRDYRDAATEKVSDWDTLMKGAFSAPIYADACQVLVNLGLVHGGGEWVPYWEPWIEWMRSQGWRRFGWYVWDQGSGLPGDWAGRLAPSFEFVFHFNKQSVTPNKWIQTQEASVKRGKTDRKRRAKGEFVPAMRGRNGVVDEKSSFHTLGQPTKVPDSVIRRHRHAHNQFDENDVHPAPFSVAFADYVIRSWNGMVYDPFTGSGTTLIACENLGRRCFAVEISPAYVAVAIERFHAATGILPRRLEGM